MSTPGYKPLREQLIGLFIAGVFIFYLLSQAKEQTLLALIVIGGIAYVGYIYMGRKMKTVEETMTNTIGFMEREGSRRSQIISDRFFVATFPKKGFVFMRQNEEFMDIAKRLAFVSVSDRSRYSDLLLYLNIMQKVYMYILDGRYEPVQYVPIFLDLRVSILENMYSLYFVVPDRFKHIYGVRPHMTIRQSIRRFQVETTKMLRVLKSYAKKTKKDPYFPIQAPAASDAPFDASKAMRLP